MSTSAKPELYRLLPSVDDVLRRQDTDAIVGHFGHDATVEAVRVRLNELRTRIASGEMTEDAIAAAVQDFPAEIERRLRDAMAYSLRPVINATGVILHTNLGRAPLSRDALQHVVEVSQGYSNLEMDLASGARGERDVHVDRLFAKLFWLNGNHVLRIALKNHIDRLGLWAVPTYTYSAPTQRGHARKIVSSKPKVTPRRELPVVSPDSAMTEL